MAKIHKRPWTTEDLMHLDDALNELLSDEGIISMPGLESMRDQLAIRLDKPTRFENHDSYVKGDPDGDG